MGGDAELFAKSLKEAGWIDEDGCIHDWHEYAGRLVDERIQSKERMRSYRERKRTAQIGSPPVTPNVRVTNGGDNGVHPASKVGEHSHPQTAQDVLQAQLTQNSISNGPHELRRQLDHSS